MDFWKKFQIQFIIIGSTQEKSFLTGPFYIVRHINC